MSNRIIQNMTHQSAILVYPFQSYGKLLKQQRKTIYSLLGRKELADLVKSNKGGNDLTSQICCLKGLL